MTAALVPGDPASISALGADLVREAALLRERGEELAVVRTGLGDWHGPAARAFDASLSAQARAVEEAAGALAEGGRALQAYAVDLRHARALASVAEQFVADHGLAVDAHARVRLPWGAYPVPEARAYAHHVAEAQRLVDRALAERDEAAHTLRLRCQGPVAALRRTPLQVDSACARSVSPWPARP